VGAGERCLSQTIFDTKTFAIAPHSVLPFRLAFNGNATRGGDNMGPIVVAALASRLNQALDASNASLMFISRDGNGLTSQTVYLFKITNHNSFAVSFVLEFFLDD
jgi:hypothetical protein